MHRVIQFNRKARLKRYIDMNTNLRGEAKNDFEKDFLKLMNNAGFGKTLENVRKHRNIKVVTTDKIINQLASEPNYHTPKHFSENLTAIEMKETTVKTSKLIYLGMSILDFNKIFMCDFSWLPRTYVNYIVIIKSITRCVIKRWTNSKA